MDNYGSNPCQTLGFCHPYHAKRVGIGLSDGMVLHSKDVPFCSCTTVYILAGIVFIVRRRFSNHNYEQEYLITHKQKTLCSIIYMQPHKYAYSNIQRIIDTKLQLSQNQSFRATNI